MNKRIITRISNELGNQLFMYASTFAIAKKLGRELLIDNETSFESNKNISNYGLDNFKIVGRADIGQSIVIQNEIILGFEAAEGTDELLKRCYEYKNRGDRGLLLKLSKYNQNLSLDLPTIGINTVKNLFKYDYEGVFIEKNKCVIIDKEEVIEYCNAKNIFIGTVDKIEKK